MKGRRRVLAGHGDIHGAQGPLACSEGEHPLGLMGASRGHMGAFMKGRGAFLGRKGRALRHEGRVPEREERVQPT
jgi:hypothetical protein